MNRGKKTKKKAACLHCETLPAGSLLVEQNNGSALILPVKDFSFT